MVRHLISAVVMMCFAALYVANVQAEGTESADAANNDVFFDNGEDFADPTVAEVPADPAPAKVETKATKAAKVVKEKTAPKEENSEPLKSTPEIQTEATTEVAQPAEDEKQLPEKAAPEKKYVAKEKQVSEPAGKGRFSVVQKDCKMHRKPASTSPTVLVVKPAKKLWVEDVNAKWVKGFRKNGTGYFPKDCFE